jgi:hypothetical protein
MHPDTNDGAGAVAATAASGRPLQLPGWGGGALVAHDQPERAQTERRARDTDAGRQLQRCFPRWSRAFEHLRLAALRRLASNEPVDPNDRDTGTAATSTPRRCCAATAWRGSAPAVCR